MCEHVPNVDIFYFDLTYVWRHEWPRDQQKYVSPDNFGRASKRRLNFENRSSSFGDTSGIFIAPSPKGDALYVDLPQLQWGAG